MAEDREVLREVWDGHIPVSFNLATDEVVTMQQPDPYYVSLVMTMCCTLISRSSIRSCYRACHTFR